MGNRPSPFASPSPSPFASPSPSQFTFSSRFSSSSSPHFFSSPPLTSTPLVFCSKHPSTYASNSLYTSQFILSHLSSGGLITDSHAYNQISNSDSKLSFGLSSHEGLPAGISLIQRTQVLESRSIVCHQLLCILGGTQCASIVDLIWNYYCPPLLHQLDFAHSTLRVVDITFICSALAYCPHLVSVNFAHSSIGDVGCEILAACIRYNNSIQWLGLHANFVGIKGAAALLKAIPESGLNGLDLTGNKCGFLCELKSALTSNIQRQWSNPSYLEELAEVNFPHAIGLIILAYARPFNVFRPSHNEDVAVSD